MLLQLLVWCYAAALLIPLAWGINALILAWRSAYRQPPAPPAEPADWPLVTVQIPLYNELAVAERVIAAVLALEYPRDRLEIQVLDTSTDATAPLLQRLVAEAQAEGHPIVLLRRTSRQGFKAGSLNFGLARARGQILALFDADFVPAPDFLRRSVPALLADERLACVQTRWGHRNGETSALTRAQALWLDHHCLSEQLGRSLAGLPVQFIGTAGLWRRTALIALGGWDTETLVEDLELSYRAQIAGWRIMLLPDLVAPAELPDRVEALAVQQFRWTRGMSQVLRRHLVGLWRAPLTLAAKLVGTLNLLNYAHHGVLTVLLLLSLPLRLADALPDALLGLTALTASLPPLLYAWTARRLGYSWPQTFRRVALLTVLWMGLSPVILRAAVAGLLPLRGDWQRTPKIGDDAGQRRERVRPRTRGSGLGGAGILALLTTCGSTLALQTGYLDSAIMLALYTIGYTWVAQAEAGPACTTASAVNFPNLRRQRPRC